jgi:phosphoglycolate phosphatase
VLNNDKPASAVVFDLDGTLVDSAPDITDALNVALTARSLGRLSVDDVRPLLGVGARALVAEAVARAGGKESDVDDVLADYGAAYEAKPVAGTTVNADAREALRTLRAAGVKVGVCTNKRTHMARAVLAGTGLADLVDVVVGIDATPRSKPDPAHLSTTLDALGVRPSDVIYVGDTEIDAQTAQALGVPYRHVAWGSPIANHTVIERFADLTGETNGTAH